MKLKLLALAVFMTALSACDNSSPKGIVGVAYEALQRGNFPLFASAFTPEARPVYATPALFARYQSLLLTYNGSFRIGAQKTLEKREKFERKSLTVLAHAFLIGGDESVMEWGRHADSPQGIYPQIFPGADAHFEPEVTPAGPPEVLVPVLVFETDCASYPDARRVCAISAVHGPALGN